MAIRTKRTNQRLELIKPGDRKIITTCLHGILANHTQFMPVRDALPGQVYGVVDSGPRYDLDALVAFTCRMLKNMTSEGVALNLVGASLGGMQVPFVVEKLPTVSRNALCKIVLVDAPNGETTMPEIPPHMAGVLASPLGVPVLAVINKFLLKPPKDEEIDLPTDWHERILRDPSLTQEDWNELIKASAMQSMSGYPNLLYHDWTGGMVQMGRDGSLERVARLLQGLDVTYVACMGPGNETVLQPAAAEWWEAYAGAKIVKAKTPHCAFLQKPEWSMVALRKAFA